MSEPVPYDDFVGIYDIWCESAPITKENKKFYVELLSASRPPVVELGVGNGRICIDVAKRGQRIFGVDSSEKILALTRSRAEEARVLDRLTLLRADFRDFELPAPAELITIPFHSIGHLLTSGDKQRALANIHRQLVPGGKLVFDHFVYDPDYPVPIGVPFLRAEYNDPSTGKNCHLWETVRRDAERQVIHLVVCSEELDEDGVVERRRYSKCDLSWMHPEESRVLLEETGFEIVAIYGDFHGTPFDETSREQVWIAKKPRGEKTR